MRDIQIYIDMFFEKVIYGPMGWMFIPIFAFFLIVLMRGPGRGK